MWPKGLEATAVLAHLVALCSCLETPQKSYLLLISAYCSFSVAYSYANAVHPGLKKCHLNSCPPFSGPGEGCLEVAGCPTPLLWAVVSFPTHPVSGTQVMGVHSYLHCLQSVLFFASVFPAKTWEQFACFGLLESAGRRKLLVCCRRCVAIAPCISTWEGE